MIVTNRFHILLLFLLTMLGDRQALAQSTPVTIDVELSRERVYVGDELTYQVLVRGPDNPPDPIIDFPPSVQAQYRGRSSQSFTSTRVINGKRRTVTDRRFSYQFVLTATQAGTVEIPAPKFTINGQDLFGESISFESLFPSKSANDFLELQIIRPDIYLGETVEVECSWWIDAQTSEFSFSSSYIPPSLQIHGLKLQATGAQPVGFDFQSQRVVGVLINSERNGVAMDKLVFRFTITPTQTGEFSLGPLRVMFTRHETSGRRHRAYVESEAIQITVHNLPTENQPVGYDGAIGTFSLHASASNTRVNVGDPIELTLEIFGDEPMAGIQSAPDLTKDALFANNFKISSEKWRETLPRAQGKRVYQTTIRALHDAIDQIPPITLHSFLPSSGAYISSQSQPIDIEVAPVQEITLSDAVITGSPEVNRPAPSVEYSLLTNTMPGLWAHDSAAQILQTRHRPLTTLVQEPWFVFAAASPPMLFGCSLVLMRCRRWKSLRARQAKVDWKRYLAMYKRGHQADALRLSIASVLNMNAEAVTAQDIEHLPLDEQTALAASQLLSPVEQHNFQGPYSTPQTPPPPPSPTLLRDIMNQIKTLEGSR